MIVTHRALYASRLVTVWTGFSTVWYGELLGDRQIMAAAALLKKKPKPTDKDIDEAMTNICRCGTYLRIRAGVHKAAEIAAAGGARKTKSA